MKLSAKLFQRTKEDFVCGQCGFWVRGNGYTNHCPNCLWSRHVDVHPVDRASDCLGMMEPQGAELKHSAYVILHQCKQCGFERRNKAEQEDNFEAIFNTANQ